MRFKEFYLVEKRELLLCGGAAGHMQNVFDVDRFSFQELKKIISKALSGQVGLTTVKLDGANLLVSWIDGRLRAARNKGNLKNFGETSMTADEVNQKFSGRGMLQKAFAESMNDLETAIGKLSEKQRNKIFQNGKKWMSFELIHPGVENVIPYNVTQINFHGTREVDEDGNTMSENKEDARILEGMLKQIKQEKQKTYNIRSIEPVTLKKIKDFTKQKVLITGKLDKYMKSVGVNNKDTIEDMKYKYFRNAIEDNLEGKYPENIIDNLSRRFAFGDKSYKIPMIKKDIKNEKDLKWILDFDKRSPKEFKKLILPLEKIFLELGVKVLENINTFVGVNPDEAINKMQKKLQNVIDMAKKSKDPKIREKLEMELDRLNAAGGINKILPLEGLVFFHGGELLKLTGTFAPSNQIMGLRFKLDK